MQNSHKSGTLISIFFNYLTFATAKKACCGNVDKHKSICLFYLLSECFNIVSITPTGPSFICVTDKLRFHEHCGTMVKLTNGNRTAERRKPVDEFNNGVVMTHRPLLDDELFEVKHSFLK